MRPRRMPRGDTALNRRSFDLSEPRGGSILVMKHSLQLKLSQHLTLTPQLQQSIRLLQLSTVELNQELERYLAENPLLERADLASPDDPNAMPPPPNGMEQAAAPAEDAPTAADDRREEQPSLAEEQAAFG